MERIITTIITTWDRVWKRYYETFESLTAVKKAALSITFALLTGVSAQFYIKLPFTPVPVTGQVFVVLLTGLLLGKNTGAVSQLLYAAGGIAGISWFYGAGKGFSPTTGYIIGFIFAAYLIGLLTEKSRTKIQMIFAMLCGIVTILLTGTLWLTFFLRVSFYKAFLIGFLPFIPFDIVKAYFAGVIAQSIVKNRE